MAETPSKPRRRWSFTLRTLFVVVGLAAVPLAWIASLYYEYQKSMGEFPGRHLEATRMIEAVYADFHRNGHWPSKMDLDVAVRDKMPKGWCGESGTSQGGPRVWLHGPFHSAIVYYFLPPQLGTISRSWVLDNEGSKSEFQADVDYSASEALTEEPPAAQADRP